MNQVFSLAPEYSDDPYIEYTILRAFRIKDTWDDEAQHETHEIHVMLESRSLAAIKKITARYPSVYWYSGYHKSIRFDTKAHQGIPFYKR